MRCKHKFPFMILCRDTKIDSELEHSARIKYKYPFCAACYYYLFKNDFAGLQQGRFNELM